MSVIKAVHRATRAIAIAAALLAAGAPAYAQQKPSSAAIATAKQIIDIKGAAGLFNPLISGVIEQVKSLYVQQNPSLVKEINEVAATLRAEFAPRRAEVIDEVARLYATHFTEQELKDLLAFYSSPLGKKMITEEPRAIEQSMAFAQNWANKLSDEVIAKMRAEMKKKGHDI